MKERFTKISYQANNDCKVITVDGYDIGKAYERVLHYDPNLTVAYFKKCVGKIKIEGDRYDIADGDIILLNDEEIHCVEIEPEVYCERITLYVSKELAVKFGVDPKLLFSAFYKGQNKLQAMAVTNYGIDSIIEEILRLSKESDERSGVMASCKCIELMFSLADAQSPDTTDAKSHNATVKKVLDYLNKSFAKISDCDEISRKFHLSKFYLSRLFRENVGVSLWDYVIFKRLLYFNELVRGGNNIEEACYKAGFNNYSNFYRLYKKHMNMTPKAFKEKSEKRI